jgi:alkylation response protein AidB-like acyl-CoA dehydrogenase
MDFALTDEQHAIVDLAKQILTDRCQPEQLKEVESGTDWFHRDLWADLAKADLLGITLPESVGGGGFGFLEACLLLTEAGRAVAPTPLWATLVASRAIADLGSDDQAQRWLPGVATGSSILAVALSEVATDDLHPQVTARAEGEGWRLTGAKTGAPAVHLADAVVVTANVAGEPAVFIVPTDAPGLTFARQDTFNHEPTFHLDLDGVVVGADARLGAGVADPVRWLVDRAIVGVCAFAAGVADAGMRLTASYVTGRHQFGKSLGTFQAVCHRMADCYVDAGAINLTMLQAATALDEAGPGDEVDEKLVAVAKYWASYSGSRVGHAGLHLHGGISIDLDYPMHRYFLWSKHLELQLGAGTAQLAHLGSILAAEPV